MKYSILTFLLIFLLGCGSVRHNRAVLNDCENKRDMYKRVYSQALLREQMYKERADSMQIVIWGLQSDLDSLERHHRGYRYTRKRKDW